MAEVELVEGNKPVNVCVCCFLKFLQKWDVVK